MKLGKFLSGCYTDAKGRPEPKMILGTLLILSSVAYLIIWKSLQGAEFIGGMGVALMGTCAIADGFNDYRMPPSDGHQIPPGE